MAKSYNRVMKRKQLRLRSKFAVVLGNDRSQAAEMVLAPRASEGGPHNRHRGADQWLYVVSGTGRATINGHRYRLRERTLLLIERGDTHQVENTSRSEPLVSLNFYVPPGYSMDGEELPARRG